jgi:hypothetical protein
MDRPSPLNPPLAPAAAPGPAATARSDTDACVRFQQQLAQALQQGSWRKLLLASPLAAAEAGVQRIAVRPLQLRGVDMLSFVHSHATRDITKNLPVPEGLALIGTLLGTAWRKAHLLTPGEELQLSFTKRGKAGLSVVRLTAPTEAEAAEPVPAVAGHDREKQRSLDLTRTWLCALGITNAQHQLVPAMSRKWKQINKFVEIFGHALETSALAQAATVRVVDFGAGRGYLTFGIHEWLQQTRQVQADVVGVELRSDLVDEANASIARLGLQGLRFESGDVRAFEAGAMNVMIALHACDTATDHAIHLGLRAGADIILCSPCCHKQIRPQLLSPHPLRPVFQHGIHAEQQAEMLTDSLRALLLEASGYDTQVFEFIALEHTRKNKMILAVKRKTVRPADAALAQIAELKRYFGIREQALETLLQADGLVLQQQDAG